jgi:hypothetical protein
LIVRRAALALVAALLAVPALVSAGATAAPKAGGHGGGAITFSSPFVVDPVHTFGEPGLSVGPDGAYYVHGPWGTGTQRSLWERSIDGGQTYRPLHQDAIGSAFESATFIPGPGGGDTEISIDHTGKVYYADLAALASLKVATWDNQSRVMNSDFLKKGEQNINGYDRQWFGIWDPPDPAKTKKATGYTGPLPVNYLGFAEALLGSSCDSGSCESYSYSTDGINYSDTTVSYDIDSDGTFVVDQKTGTVIEAIQSHDEETDVDYVAAALVTRDPAQHDDPALRNAQIVRIAPLDEGTEVGALFPVSGIDSGRNAYVVWVTRADGQTVDENPKAWQIYYSYASAATGWTNWSAPVRVSPAGPDGKPTLTNIMPWAVAGSAGRLAVVYYSTPDTADEPSQTDSHQPWDVHLSMVTGANSSAPRIDQITVTPHPMHYGTICLQGLGCIAQLGNRNLADFFEVNVDPRDGAIVISYNDTSNELTQSVAGPIQIPPPADGVADHRGARA